MPIWLMRELLRDAEGKGGGGDGGGSDSVAGGDADPNAGGEGGKDKTGKDKPSDKEAALLKEVMSKKGKITELEGTLSTLQAQLKQFEGIDAAKVRELLAAQQEAETKRLEAAGEWDRLKGQMAEAHQREVETYKGKVTDLEGKVTTLGGTIDNLTVGQSFSGSAFIVDEVLLTPTKARVVYGANFDVEDGNLVGYDKPRGAAGRTKLVDSRGEPLGFEDAIKKIIEADPDRDRILKSKMRAGGDSRPSQHKAQDQAPQVAGRSRIAAILAKQSKR